MRKILLYLGLALILSCHKNPKVFNTPIAYDLNHPETFQMPEALLEISGQAFHRGNSDTLFAVQDESGIVYAVKLGQGIVQKSKFKMSGDFEDLAIADELVVVLKSNGKIYTFPFTALKNKKIENAKVWRNLLPKGEYEGLAFQNNQLYVLCKSCQVDLKKKQVSGYRLQIDDFQYIKVKGDFKIDVEQIEKILPIKQKRFKPSALAFNSKLQQWFVLSSVNKMLVITNPNWKVVAAYRLNPRVYIQPEGIAFDRNYTLFISSEGSEIKNGRVFKIPYRIKSSKLPE